MKQPALNEIDLDEVMKNLLTGKPCVVITMSRGQWDKLLDSAYTSGHILLELDRNEKPVRAYRRASS
jgi:hypothetical protein